MEIIAIKKEQIKDIVRRYIAKEPAVFKLYKNNCINPYSLESKLAHDVFIENHKLIMKQVLQENKKPFHLTLHYSLDEYIDFSISNIITNHESNQVIMRFLNSIRKKEINSEISIELEVYYYKKDIILGYIKNESEAKKIIDVELYKAIFSAKGHTIDQYENDIIKKHFDSKNQCFFDVKNLEKLIKYSDTSLINSKKAPKESIVTFIKYNK